LHSIIDSNVPCPIVESETNSIFKLLTQFLKRFTLIKKKNNYQTIMEILAKELLCDSLNTSYYWAHLRLVL